MLAQIELLTRERDYWNDAYNDERKEYDDRVNDLHAAFCRECAGLREQINQLIDPIVRAKMLEPMPPYFIVTSEAEKQRIVAMLDAQKAAKADAERLTGLTP